MGESEFNLFSSVEVPKVVGTTQSEPLVMLLSPVDQLKKILHEKLVFTKL